MRPFSLLTVLGVCVMALWPSPTSACTCLTASVCDAAWKTEAVFVGHVVSIESTPAAGRIVQLAVLEGFRGFRLTQVAIATASNEAACGYPFRIGESYLVYANRSLAGGPLSAGLCSRTRPVADATEDLTYLRSLAAIVPGSRARVVGQVQLSESSRPAGREPTGMGGVTVIARGEGRTFSTRTDARGGFVLTNLPVATYALEATAPDGYASIPRSLEIHDPRGCGSTVLYVRHDSRVSGRVVDSRGVGVGALPLDLVPRAGIDRPEGGSGRVRTRTAADGTFELQLVSPGEYVLGFNFLRTLDNKAVAPRALYPGVTDASVAGTIVVAAGQRVRLKDFPLPQTIRLVTISGTVVDEAGRPVRGASVGISRDTEGGGDSAGPGLVTGDDGRFAFTIAEGGRYFVHATRYVGSTPRNSEVHNGAHTFTATPGAHNATIVVKRNVP
jgi:hypothetical protein